MLNINDISSKSDKFQDLPFLFRDLISLLTEKLREKRAKKTYKENSYLKTSQPIPRTRNFPMTRTRRVFSKFSKKMHRVTSIEISKV